MNTNGNGMAVVVNDLEKRFGSFIAVNRVSFQVPKGEIFGFLGPNGAGKSTTIRVLTGILAPSAGNGTVAGFDVRREAEKIKANIGYMSQKFSLYEDLTVEENIDFYAGIYRIPQEKRKERKEWVIEMAGLKEPALAHGHPPGRLEAAAVAGLRDPARAAHHLPGRAHCGRRSGQPPPVLGPDLRAV
jgi:ABC-2 type transport system ATP-binding protein